MRFTVCGKVHFLCIVLCQILPVSGADSWFDVGHSSGMIQYTGRTYKKSGGTALAWSGSSASIVFTGTAVKAHLEKQNPSDPSHYKVFVDDSLYGEIGLDTCREKVFTLAENLKPGPHKVTLYKRTEVVVGIQVFKGFQLFGEPNSLRLDSRWKRKLEFAGNSITCGYGSRNDCKVDQKTWQLVACPEFSASGEDHWNTYAAVTARALNAEHHAICWSGKGVFRNYTGDSAGPKLPDLWEHAEPIRTIDEAKTAAAWDFTSWIPHAVIVNLGTNDFSYTTAPDSAAFEAAYAHFLERIRKAYPKATLILLDGPMMSDSYPPNINALTRLKNHLKNLTAQMDDVHHVSLTPNRSTVWGVGADWHPNQKQHALNGEELTSALRRILKWEGEGEKEKPLRNRRTSPEKKNGYPPKKSVKMK